MRNALLFIQIPEANGMYDKTGKNTIPIEEIGVVILDNQQFFESNHKYWFKSCKNQIVVYKTKDPISESKSQL